MRTTTFISESMQKASIRLFHAIVENKSSQRAVLADMLKYGVVLVDKKGAIADIDYRTSRVIVDALGLNPVNWAQSFHKSWDKVATTSAEQLISEQIQNYFSTYGLESLGLKACNYVPVEKILVDLTEKPAIEAFTIVRVLSEQDLHDELTAFLKSTKAPHKDQIEDIKTLLPLADNIAVDDIKSFEIKIMYCDLKGLVPLDAQDFLRFAVYKATGKTTLVKDAETIEELKRFARTSEAEQMFEAADLAVLSEAFYRFKPLFLAFKSNSKLSPTVNKIRRLAVKNHKPVSGLTASGIMNLLTENRECVAHNIICKADNRELIKLINFARNELVSKAHVYNIRNGKTYVKAESESGIPYARISHLDWLTSDCLGLLKYRLAGVFSGKTFYIPAEIKYAAPTSEKQMMDVLPYGTKVYLPEDAKAFCISGHWMNDVKFNPHENGRIDLDFHLSSACGSVGWNSNYRTTVRDILFSGDMTNAPAPCGAVESFRISENVDAPYELSVNVYNTSGNIPYELLFTKDITDQCDFSRDSESMISAVVNPANAIAPSLKLHVHSSDEVIGYYCNRSFTIYGGGLGGRRVPNTDLMIDALKASMCRCDNMMDISAIIELAGGTVTHRIPEDGEYIDLSVGNLTSTTLFDVVDGKPDKLPLAVIKAAA